MQNKRLLAILLAVFMVSARARAEGQAAPAASAPTATPPAAAINDDGEDEDDDDDEEAAQTPAPTPSVNPVAPAAAPDLQAKPPAPAATTPALVAAPTPAPAAVPPPPAAKTSEMDWFGMGVRIGQSSLALIAGTTPVVGPMFSSAITDANTSIDSYNALNPSAPVARYSLSDMNLSVKMLSITPVLHLGGSGYFFKFEFPIGRSATLNTYGLGLYPVNIGVYISRVRLFPYISFGTVFNYASSNKFIPQNGASSTVKQVGAILQARAAGGLKFRPIEGLSLSADVGYTPLAVGAIVDPSKFDLFSSLLGGGSKKSSTVTAGSLPPDPGTGARGGLGKIIDFSLGVEWL